MGPFHTNRIPRGVYLPSLYIPTNHKKSNILVRTLVLPISNGNPPNKQDAHSGSNNHASRNSQCVMTTIQDPAFSHCKRLATIPNHNKHEKNQNQLVVVWKVGALEVSSGKSKRNRVPLRQSIKVGVMVICCK